MLPPQAKQFATWSQQIQASDVEAFAALFSALHPGLLRYARQFITCPGPQEDIIQEAFLQLWERRTTLDPALSIKAFLYRMVRNRCLNYQRNAATRSTLLAATPIPSHRPGPGDHLDMEHLERELRAWIQELPPRRREAFELSRFAGLGYQEIAHVMDISSKTVEKHITSALHYVRARLRTYDPDLLQ